MHHHLAVRIIELRHLSGKCPPEGPNATMPRLKQTHTCRSLQHVHKAAVVGRLETRSQRPQIEVV